MHSHSSGKIRELSLDQFAQISHANTLRKVCHCQPFVKFIAADSLPNNMQLMPLRVSNESSGSSVTVVMTISLPCLTYNMGLTKVS